MQVAVPSDRPAISVILCTYNRSPSLKLTLDSLCKMQELVGGMEWELVVVDNNSQDDTEEVVRNYQRVAAFPVRYVKEKEQGLSRARNRGIVASRAAILAFIDDDVTVDPRWLGQLHATYAMFHCVGVGGRIVPVWASAKPAWLKEDGPYTLMKAIVDFDQGEQVCRLHTPPFGANMSFRRSAFDTHGLFRPELGRCGGQLLSGEDTEFGRRLLQSGQSLMYNPAVVVYHHVSHHRLTRSYFRRWYFDYGRTAVRLAGGRQSASLSATASLLRSVCASVYRWVTARGSTQRFHSALNVYLVLGRLFETTTALFRRLPKHTIPRLPDSSNY